MRKSILSAAFALAAGAAVLLPAAARADAIDGNWCLEGTRKFMTIDGVRIVTPGGSATEGNYTRHAFDYVIPPPEPQAGTVVGMLLANENTVYLKLGTKVVRRGEPGVEIWHRCNRPTA
jgi:hypothetical protein